ncbi:MAG: helix-turn-helix transcriptional regulator [Methylobacterium radiotolerans]
MQRHQLRAARAALGWSQDQLAAASGVSVPTIKRLEPGFGLVQTRVDTLDKLRRALEAAGVEFRPDGFVGLVRDASGVAVGTAAQVGDAVITSESVTERMRKP